MTVKPYGREHAMALLEPSGYTDDWTIDDRGIWPHARHKMLHTWGMDTDYQMASWKPASVFADAPDAPDLSKTPALPFPFDGRDLAAFMLTGYGCLVADFYGEWASGPGAHKLSRIDPDNNFAKRALTEAFDAYRNAVGRVGELDLELYRQRGESCEAYSEARDEAIERHDTHAVAHPKPTDGDDRRREMDAEYTRRMALVNAELEAQEAEMNHLQAEWDKAYQTWLTAMVVCLLEPKPKAATVKPGTNKKWTPEFTNEVRAYRANHTEAQTAEKYGVAGSLIRRKLAESKNASKPKATPFSVLVHRSK